ncbi:DUF3298 domain-containing protein [Romboutsia sp.]|uniref:DUF3298 and DUF4163 domain-containing protein n=1 Tax=Romboutsia sp. TaxID=1965302 RepID=UPI003F3CFFC6
MLSIKTLNIEEKNQLVIYNLNYPFIESDEHDQKIINYINEVIYQDIISFKDVVEQELESLISRRNYLSYINTEYQVSFNKNNLISLTIEFSQLAGLQNITYSNSYNYDLESGKQIKLRDIFKQGIDYETLLNSSIKKELETMECVTDEIGEEEIRDYLDNLIICYDQNFYIEYDGIAIYFSSYELDQSVSEVVAFKIPFKYCIDYLSKYAMKRVKI